MNSIESLKLEYNSQIKDLKKTYVEKLFDNCVFVGSGDSYVAGLIVEFITDHKCRSYSPSDLLNSGFTESDTYCFISMTGETKANIRVAKLARKAGVRTMAVTLNKNSMLAQTCNEIIPIKITRIPASTSSYSSFVVSLVTCLQIAGITIPQNFNTWQKNALEISQSFAEVITLPKKDPIYLLGNNLLYALAQYASLKLTEFFGVATITHKLEEFCHSPIFGTQKFHHLWILGQNELHISQSIENLGLNVSYCELYNSNKIAQSIQSIFILQNLMLLLAERHKLTQVKYLLAKDKLRTSSELIYK